MSLSHALFAARLRLFARHLGASRRPILIGPWRSEVGFEVLYWLPFLHQLRAEFGWDKSRLIALSRGGAAAWYDTAGAADLYDYLPYDTVRLHTWAALQRQRSTKQMRIEPWERHAAALAASSLGLHKPILFHPSWMYRLLAPYWGDQMAVGPLSRWIDPKPMPMLPLPDGLVLPERFVAVRIYARSTMEPHDNVMMTLRAWLAKLAVKQPIIYLSGTTRYDDHADLLVPHGPNQVELSKWLTPTNNLAVQAAVLQRASLFVGTYGGLAQLALRLRIPTVATITKWEGTAYAHLDLTHRLAVSSGVPFHLVRVQDTEALEKLL